MPATFGERALPQLRKSESALFWMQSLTPASRRGLAEEEDPRATPDPVSPERLQLADAGILHLSPLVGQLVELWKEPEEDEYGRLRPTRYAFDRSVQLLVDAAIEAYPRGRPIPSGCVSTDSEGGVRIEWVRPTASVHVVVPAAEDGPAYVYHEVSNDYVTEEVTPERVAYWLQRID